MIKRRKKLPRGQTKLEKEEPSDGYTVKYEATPPWTQYRCPFCLGEYPSYRFEVLLKSGKKSGKAKCPECEVTFLWVTLVKDMSPVEYAEWLYGYMGYGGYKKISWYKLKARLKDMGIANTFWTAWKNAKANKWADRGIMTDEQSDRMYEEYKNDRLSQRLDGT